MSVEKNKNPQIQWIVPREASQSVWDVYAQVFPDKPHKYGSLAHREEPLFVDPGWKIVGLVNGLMGLAFRPHAPAEVRDGSLTWEDWQFFMENDFDLDRGGFYERDELGPLLDIVAGEGAQTLYFTDSVYQDPEPLQAGVASRAGLEAAVQAISDSPEYYGIPSSFVFDDTGRWGLRIHEDNIAFLGAASDLMERYLPAVGGLEFLQERFANHIRQDFMLGEEINRVSVARAFRREYAYMDWPWPFPELPI